MTESGKSTPVVTVAAAAELTGLDPKTVNRMIRSGELPYEQKLPGKTGAYLLSGAVVQSLAERMADEAEKRARDIRDAITERQAAAS